MKELNPLGSFAERQAVPVAALHQTAHYNLPDARGHFGPYGGSFVSETLTLALNELSGILFRRQHETRYLRQRVHGQGRAADGLPAEPDGHAHIAG